MVDLEGVVAALKQQDLQSKRALIQAQYNVPYQQGGFPLETPQHHDDVMMIMDPLSDLVQSGSLTLRQRLQPTTLQRT
eukprot:162130-Rhodomonas_salina.2